MAKTLVYERDDDSRIPFLRGILTRTLQDSGLPFAKSYEIATQVRNEIADREEISTDEISAMIQEILRRDFDEDVVRRYQSRRAGEVPITILGRDGETTPFSRVRLTQCLESCALAPEIANDVTFKIHQEFIDKGTTTATSAEVCGMAYQLLLDSLGPKSARRYLVWVEFLRTNRPLLLLIGGGTGSGKSTVASMLAHRLDIVRTQSTDMLREVMRLMIGDSLMPALHTSTFTAYETLPGVSNAKAPHEELLINGYLFQAEKVHVAIDGVMQRAVRERVPMIIEGIHLSPQFLQADHHAPDTVIVPLMLGVLNKKQLKKNLKGRSQEAPDRRAQRYLNHFDDIWALQSYLLSEADRNNLPIIRNSRVGRTVNQVLDIITNKLSEDFSGDPKKVFDH